MNATVAMTHDPYTDPTPLAPEAVLLSAARHCADEGLLQSAIRWNGWAEYQLNRTVSALLFEDLASMVDMAVRFENGSLDYGVYGYHSKNDAISHYMNEADHYAKEILA